ncbi:MAG: surface lipoprotein assembly modifier [Paracoccaceae bacterium]|nr:surface lipoprotein assembly modifier [Paracoccaceae bacterium]
MIRILALFLALFIGAASPAMSQSLDTQISRLINLGRYAEAQALLEASDPDEEDRLFFIGRVLKSRGFLMQAIELFQNALEIDPRHINARRELTHSLILARRFAEAQRNLDMLDRDDPTPAMRPVYDTFQRLIDENKPAGMSASFALVPSTNINRGTAETIFQSNLGSGLISEDDRQTSGIGVQIGVHGFLRNRLSEHLRLVLMADLWATKYSDSDYDNLQSKLTASLQGRSSNLRWSLAPYVRQKWSTENTGSSLAPIEEFTNSLRAAGAELNLQFQLGDKNAVQLGLLTEERHFPAASFQDGRYDQLRFSYSRRLTDSLWLAGGLSLSPDRPDPAHLRYDGTELNGSIRKVWSKTLDTSLGISFGQRTFEGDYPFRDAPRKDDYWSLSAGVRNTEWTIMGNVPGITCSYGRTSSNIEFFDYNVTECQIVFERRF